MDSMTEKELDSDFNLFKKEPSRIYRVSRGSGVIVQGFINLSNIRSARVAFAAGSDGWYG